MYKKDITQLEPNKKNDALTILPLGGCGLFGMNSTLYTYNNSSILIDAGSTFAEPWMTGVSFLVPDLGEDFLKVYNVKAIFLTHGHEDHIGNLPFILKEDNLPIYCTRWTSEIITRKLSEHFILPNITIVDEINHTINLKPFTVEFFSIPHSIPQATSLLIKAEDRSAFHTGDFKLNGENIPNSLKRHKGEIDVLLCDSTNADKPGFCPTEGSVTDPLKKVIQEAKQSVFIATFSSHIERIKIISNICKELGRRVFLTGTSLNNNFKTAVKLGLIKENAYEEVDKNTQNIIKKVVVVTGGQAELRSSLSRIVFERHHHLSLRTNDTVIFSSRVIPGNEKNILHLINELSKKSVHYITTKTNHDIHVSGHGHREDIRVLREFLKPKTFIPIHGDYNKLLANINNNSENSLLIKTGDKIQTDNNGTKVFGEEPTDVLYVDELSGQKTEKATLLEKIRLAKKGTVHFAGVFSKTKELWQLGPKINILGLSNKKELEEKIEQAAKNWQPPEKSTSTKKLVGNLQTTLERALLFHLKKRTTLITSVWFID